MVKRKSNLSRPAKRVMVESEDERQLRLSNMREAAYNRRNSETIDARQSRLSTSSAYSQQSNILIYRVDGFFGFYVKTKKSGFYRVLSVFMVLTVFTK